MKFIKQVQAGLEALNGYQVPYAVQDFLVPSKSTDQLVVKESSDDAEILVCLQEGRLKRLSDRNFPDDFSFEILPDLSVVIEELSHFNTYCLSALQDREISSLELEVQGEIDKFGVALGFLHQKNEENLKEKLFDNLFSEMKLGDWVEPENHERYFAAHRIARNFCRNLLEKGLNYQEAQGQFKGFFEGTRAHKLGPKY